MAKALNPLVLECGMVLGYDEMKQKQVDAVCTFLQGKDTFVSLPTGYGKSLIYAILPITFDKLRG